MVDTLRALERFLLPNACVVCDAPVSSGEPDALVCALCRHRLRPLVGGCARCQQPVPLVGPCRFCQTWPAALRRVRSAVWLDDEAREILHHFKYDGYTALGDMVASAISRRVPRPGEAVLVAVPLAPARRRARGYNQAAVIAAALARRWRLPLAEHVLSRVRETRSQTALSPEARAANVRGAFVAERREQRAGRVSAPIPATSPTPLAPPRRAEGRGSAAVILLDDVLTTGATVAAAAAALGAAGWGTVDAVTFARALPFERRIAVEPDSSEQFIQRG